MKDIINDRSKHYQKHIRILSHSFCSPLVAQILERNVMLLITLIRCIPSPSHSFQCHDSIRFLRAYPTYYAPNKSPQTREISNKVIHFICPMTSSLRSPYLKIQYNNIGEHLTLPSHWAFPRHKKRPPPIGKRLWRDVPILNKRNTTERLTLSSTDNTNHYFALRTYSASELI
jgi:hypothetical protein